MLILRCFATHVRARPERSEPAEDYRIGSIDTGEPSSLRRAEPNTAGRRIKSNLCSFQPRGDLPQRTLGPVERLLEQLATCSPESRLKRRGLDEHGDEGAEPARAEREGAALSTRGAPRARETSDLGTDCGGVPGRGGTVDSGMSRHCRRTRSFARERPWRRPLRGRRRPAIDALVRARRPVRS